MHKCGRHPAALPWRGNDRQVLQKAIDPTQLLAVPGAYHLEYPPKGSSALLCRYEKGWNGTVLTAPAFGQAPYVCCWRT
jgi:hypothetical protein